MASILDALYRSNSDLDPDLEYAARDAAYKRRMLEFAPPPSPEPEPVDGTPTPSALSAFTDAAWKAMFGPPEASMTPPGQTLPPVSGELTNLPSETLDTIETALKLKPDGAAPEPEKLRPLEKLQRDKAQIKMLLRNQDAIDLFTIGREYDKEFIKQNNIVSDYDKLPAYEFAKKYGTDTYNDLATLGVGGREVISDAKSTGGLASSLQDIAVHATSAAIRGGADVLALASHSLLNPVARGFDLVSGAVGGPRTANYTDSISLGLAKVGHALSEGLTNTLQSEHSEKQERVGDIQTQADHIDQELSYAQNLRDEGETIANFRYVGQSVVDGFKRVTQNPKLLENLVSEGVGSLATLGPVTKGLSLAHAGVASTELGKKVLGRLAPVINDGTRFSTAVGIQEAGGAFSETALRVAGMDHQDLMQTSEEYRNLIASGFGEQEAKTRLAVEAGATAAPLAFGTGFLTSKLAPRQFETNLLNRGANKTFLQSARELPGIMIREAVEETPQSAAGQLATNLALKQHVDPEQSALENVGEAGVQGGLAGLGVGPMIRVPGLALKGTKEVIKAPFQWAAKKGAQIQAEIDAGAPATFQNLNPAVQTLAENAPAVGEQLRTLAAETQTAFDARAAETAPAPTDVEPTESLTLEETQARAPTETETTPVETAAQTSPEQAENFIKQVETAATVTPEDLGKLPPVLLNQVKELGTELGRMPNRFEAMDRLGKVAVDEKATPEDRASAAVFIANIINSNEALFGEEQELPAFLSDVDQTHPARQQFDNMSTVLRRMRDNPTVKEALDYLETKAAPSDKDLSQVDLESDKGQQVINNVVGMATHAPQRSDEKQIDYLLQADADISTLTPRQRQVLRAAKSTLAADRIFAANNRLPEQTMVEQEVLEQDTELAETQGADEATIAKAKAKRTEAKAKKAAATPTAEPIVEPVAEPELSEGEQNLGLITRQIETEGGAKKHQKSIVQHTTEIAQAIMSGDVAALTKGIRHLSMFAQSQRNKLAAYQDSIDGKGSTNPANLGHVPYEAFDGKRMRPADGVFTAYFNTKSPNSVKAAQQVYAEATALTKLANDYIAAHPETGLTPSTDEIKLTLPGSKTQVTTRGSSTTEPQVTTPTPATTSKTAPPAEQLELPLAPARDQAPAATDTTTTTAQTSAEAQTQITPEEVRNETRFTQDRLKKYITQLRDRHKQGTITPRNEATLKVLEDEANRRAEAVKAKAPKPEQQAPSATPVEKGAQSSINPEKAQSYDRDDLITLIEKLKDRRENETISPRQEATLDVLEAEANRRAQKHLVDKAQTPPTPPKKGAIRVLVTGGRDFTDQAEMDRVLDQIHRKRGISAIIAGGARGADTLAANWARRNNVALEEKPADWKKHGKSAGFKRNQEMLTKGKPNVVMAFPGGKGTAHMVETATKAGVKVFQNIDVKPEAKGSEEAAEEARKADQNEGAPETEIDDTQPVEPAPEPTEVPLDLIDTLEVEETPEQDIKAAFPNLVQAAKNWFHKAFKIPKKITSRLSLLAQPLVELGNLLNSTTALANFLKDAKIEGYQPNANDLANHQALLQLGEKALRHMNTRLTKALNEVKPYNGVTQTILKHIQDNVNQAIRTRNNRILNLLEINEKGYKYNPQLIQSAIIAGLDWAMNIGDRQVPVDVQDVARIMGIDESEAGKYLDEFKRGLSMEMAVRSLADNIKKFWGVQTNRDTNEDFTKGIPEAVAKEILMGLEHVGLIKTGTIDHTIPVIIANPKTGRDEIQKLTAKQFGHVWFDERPKPIEKLIVSLDRTHNLLRDIAVVDAEKEGYSVGVPITDVDKTQLRQQMVETTAQHKKALWNAQHVPHFLDRTMLNLYQSMDLEGFVSLMSGRPYKEGDLEKTYDKMGYNKVDWESVKGRQRGLRATYRNIHKQLAAMQAHADENNIDITEVPVFYKHHINRLGRPQMDGASNPQTDKTARHTFLPTRSILDLSVPGSPAFQRFLLTVGQGLGLKTEREFRDDIAAKVLNLVMEPPGENEAGIYNALFQALKVWVQSDQKNITAETYELLKAAKLTDHGLHSLIAMARYDVTRETGGNLTSFEHFNPLEADGKTNGPLNALMMAAGMITVKWLKTVAKGGVFFGRLNKTLSQHYLEDSADLYQTVSDLTTINMNDLGERLRNQNDPEAYKQFEIFRRFLALINADVSFNADGELVLKRGIAKSPQTKSVYGAGSNSLAVSITNDLLDTLYSALSDDIRTGVHAGDILYGKGGANQLVSDLRELISNEPIFVSTPKFKGWVVAPGSEASNRLATKAQEVELTAEQFYILKQNVRAFLVDPMQLAIKSTVNEHVKEVTDKIQQATQIQSIFLRNMFIGEVIASMAEKKANQEKYDYAPGEISLSENDMNRIRKLLLAFSPFIDTGTQRYMMSGGETTNLFEKITVEVDGKPVTIRLPDGYSRTLDDKLSTAIYIYGATYAGVRAIPTLNVGSGDGQMMLNMLANHPEEMKRMLHVFDGLYMPADKIEEYSRLVNESVYQTWTKNTNPLRAVADSFEAFMRTSPVDRLFPGTVRGEHQQEALYEITKVARNEREPEAKNVLTSAQADTYMRQLVDKLHNLADRLDVRRQLYTEFDLSIDHMASGESPYVHEGSIKLAPNVSMEDLADAMAKRQAELEAKIKPRPSFTAAKTAAQKVVTAAIAVNTKLNDFLHKHALVDDETGAQVVNVRQLRNLSGLTNMMSRTIENLAKDNYLIVFGMPSQLNQWTLNNRPDRYKLGMHDEVYGLVDPVARIVYVSSSNPETLAHELVHASTYDKVWLYYNGSEDRARLLAEDRDAIVRIEALMGEWRNRVYSDSDLMADASATIFEYTLAGNKAAAMNEFMAYVLSHQELAESANIKTGNPLSRIIDKTLQAIKKLIWGKNLPDPGDTILSNLRFNTAILLATPTPLMEVKQDASQVMLFQSPAFGNNDRLTTVRDGFTRKIIAWLNEPAHNVPGYATPAQRAVENQKQKDRRERELIGTRLIANNFIKEFARHFPDLGKLQGWSTFEAIQATLMTDIKINPNVMTRLQELYDHVISKLQKEDFRTNSDPNDVVDDQKAQDKFDALHGLKIFHNDTYGRSSFMSSFLALAMSSDEFRNILAKMEKPKTEENLEGGVDAWLENNAMAMLDRTSMALSGERSTSQNVTDALDDLTVKMMENITDQQKYIDVKANNGLNAMDQAVAEGIQKMSATAIAKSNQAIASSGSKAVRGGARLVRTLATIINEQAAQDAQLMLVQGVNKYEGLESLRAVINDFIGRSKDNANVWDLISKVRAIAQQTRQRYRETFPKAIAKKFSRPLRTEERTAIFKLLGKTDAAAMFATQKAEDALETMTDDRVLNGEIRVLEATIRGYEGARATKVIQKARQLAVRMGGGAHGVNPLSNAHAISRLYDEKEYQKTLANPQLEADVDRLVTLYALQNVSQEDKALIKELMQNEKDLEGLKFVYHYLVGLRKNELAKLSGRLALPNHVKGSIPSEQQNEGSLKVVNDTEHAQMTKLGYAKLGPYAGSSADRTLKGKSYYFSPVSARAPFRQGIMQTVRYTAAGIDPNTGYLSDELTAGRIDNQQVVDLIRKQIPKQRQTDENLRAIFDLNTGEVVAYERLLDPAKIVGLDHSTDIFKMMGAWKGRQVEEAFAPALNEELVDELKRSWDNGVKDGRSKEFTNVMKSTDPVLVDAVKLIPNYTRDYMKTVFGTDTLMVRRDLELQALGDRQASVGDMFTGNTRWPPGVQERFEKIALGLFATAPFKKLLGDNKAYTSLVKGEQFVGDFVTSAKNLIAIKSVVVPVANIMSNFGQLLNRGVPYRDIISKFPKKVIEINTYIRLRNKAIELELDLEAAKGENKLPDIRKLESRLRAIEDSYKRLSIYPLIQGGQFASISNGQVTAEDLALAEGKWSQFVEKMINKIPDNGLRTLVKYGMVSKDTALYKVLAASVQYGDFVGKAILYDHLTEKQGKSEKEAVAEVSEAFINYNVLAGRNRDWLERNGLLWFYNYKLRAMKEAAYMIRNHPLKAIIMMTAPGLSALQSPLDSNFLSLAVDGDLPWSIGPGMGLNSWAMNPWVNLTGLD